jgi:hypothetical protein
MKIKRAAQLCIVTAAAFAIASIVHADQQTTQPAGQQPGPAAGQQPGPGQQGQPGQGQGQRPGPKNLQVLKGLEGPTGLQDDARIQFRSRGGVQLLSSSSIRRRYASKGRGAPHDA